MNVTEKQTKVFKISSEASSSFNYLGLNVKQDQDRKEITLACLIILNSYNLQMLTEVYAMKESQIKRRSQYFVQFGVCLGSPVKVDQI